MHMRRALLLMAVVLLAAAAVQFLVPAPRTSDRPARDTRPARPPTPAAVARNETVHLRYPPAKERPSRSVPRGTHLILHVAARGTGQVEVPGFGLVQAVEPGTPVLFDVLASRPGRYDVVFQPVVGRSVRIGRVIVSGSGRRP
jgi:hypothetical protein